MLRKTACFFRKIVYASRLMTLCGAAYSAPHNNIGAIISRQEQYEPAKLPILGINALVPLAIGVAIAAKNRLFLPQNRLRFSLDDIVRYCLKKTGDYFAKNSPVFCKIDKTQLSVDKIPSVFGGVASEKLL